MWNQLRRKKHQVYVLRLRKTYTKTADPPYDVILTVCVPSLKRQVIFLRSSEVQVVLCFFRYFCVIKLCLRDMFG